MTARTCEGDINTSMRQYYVYILASHSRALYVGVTNDLERRTQQHRSRAHVSFTNRYGITKLVFFEVWTNIVGAISREKTLKRWPRSRKYRLIEFMNPDWRDLSIDWWRDPAPRKP
jgi:putative endonuclease